MRKSLFCIFFTLFSHFSQSHAGEENELAYKIYLTQTDATIESEDVLVETQEGILIPGKIYQDENGSYILFDHVVAKGRLSWEYSYCPLCGKRFSDDGDTKFRAHKCKRK